jgi:hypothetical protein
MTTTPLIGGLEGAIGSEFLPAPNRLVFVEYGGRLSCYDMVPAARLVSQVSAVLKGTFLFDLACWLPHDSA